MNLSYQPGLHLLCTWQAPDEHLRDMNRCKSYFQQQAAKHELQVLGEVYHQFQEPGGGFTACICLSESHLSIHTWPEFGHLTFDLFLSNHLKDNSAKVKQITEETRVFFQASVVAYHELLR